MIYEICLALLFIGVKPNKKWTKKDFFIEKMIFNSVFLEKVLLKLEPTIALFIKVLLNLVARSVNL
jgi:hypothetical protein